MTMTPNILFTILSPTMTVTLAGEQFCGLDVNTPLGGELPITAAPVKISLLLFQNHFHFSFCLNQRVTIGTLHFPS